MGKKRAGETDSVRPSQVRETSSQETIVVDRQTVKLTHTDRVLFPEDGITKGDLIRYYRAVADPMLPYLKERPLTLYRYPGGVGKEGFVQKEAPDYYPDWIKRVSVAKEGGRLTEVVCDSAATLIYLVNQACITFHTWLSRIDNLDYPDRLIFDLDPASDDFEIVRSATRSLYALLEEIGLPSYVMTTGSRGLHVAVPLDRSADFQTVRNFAQDVAWVLVQRDPERLTMEPRKEQRQGRLYVDTLRNAYASTAVTPYSVRAKPSAPVATPLEWNELEAPGLSSHRYTINNLMQRLEGRSDPWRAMLSQAISLDGARRRLEALLSRSTD